MRTIAIIVILVLLAAVTVWGMSIKKANADQKVKSETVQSGNDKSDSTKADKSSDKASKKKSTEKSKKTASSSASETKATAKASTAKSSGKYVTVSINCSELSNDMSKLKDQSEAGCVPSNGVILGSTRYKFSSGDTVYDALEAVCRSENILLDSEYDSTYNTRYIKGIGGLYEKKAGGNSGWLYYVNGVKPDYGCSQYKLKKGDVIKWKYTVNYAND